LLAERDDGNPSHERSTEDGCGGASHATQEECERREEKEEYRNRIQRAIGPD
jgi:hypothetical protein